MIENALKNGSKNGSKNELKIGVMGCGMIAEFGHIPAILATEGLQPWAVYDPDPARAYGLQHKYGIPHGYAVSDMFFESGLDAVVVTSAAPAHRQNVAEAARHGLPVLCEKPLAMTDSDAELMIHTMNDAGLLLATGFCYRFSPVAQNIKRLVQDGAIGEAALAAPGLYLEPAWPRPAYADGAGRAEPLLARAHGRRRADGGLRGPSDRPRALVAGLRGRPLPGGGGLGGGLRSARPYVAAHGPSTTGRTRWPR